MNMVMQLGKKKLYFSYLDFKKLQIPKQMSAKTIAIWHGIVDDPFIPIGLHTQAMI